MNTTRANPTASAASPTAAAPAAQTPITGTANSSNHGTKISLQASYQSLITALQTYYQPTDTFFLKTGAYPRDAVIEELRKFVVAAETTKASNTSWRADVQAEREQEAQTRPLRSALRGIIAARFGADGTQLMEFGFLPKKRAVKSAQTKAQAVVKGKATRTARATKGKKQRKLIKGSPAATAPATSTPAATAAPTTAPAAASSAAPAAAPNAVPSAGTGHS